ncbi:kinase-like protein [Hypoxylon fuscum]|nr:kinase-like protein [Hypoxylon fuscum]
MELEALVGGSDAVPGEEIIEYESTGSGLGVEDVQMYNPGGHHPVHLDDILDGRFEVTHKLGNGGFGIVWLCRDLVLKKWRAVKILTAKHSSKGIEERIFNHLRNQCTSEDLAKNHISLPLEDFWIQGPNGRHLCVVMPVFGWAVSSWRLAQRGWKETTNTNARDVCRQIIESLHFLHSHGICHGDFRPNNILMKIEGINDLSQEEILELMGEPECIEIETVSGQPPGPRAPEYCVPPVDPFWCENISTNSIVIIDFGESFFTENSPKSTGIPNLYAPPEVMFENSGKPGPYSDIWALACTIFEVRTSEPLFTTSGSLIDIPIDDIELYLGRLPPVYSKAYLKMLRKIRSPSTPRRRESDSESANSKALNEPELQQMMQSDPLEKERVEFAKGSGYSDVLEARLGAENKVYRDLQDPKDLPPDQQSEFIVWKYSREEVVQFADLLRKMLSYEPAERIQSKSVIWHPWVICQYLGHDSLDLRTSSSSPSDRKDTRNTNGTHYCIGREFKCSTVVRSREGGADCFWCATKNYVLNLIRR